ncbi:MAG: hypothetical protein A2096_05380 [Spirochaetes bacterium GWF1_41_5]|nr:MAG: hypothetical protein A2096_05380 [Spirochaetes bacterium GWF1_41_5]HBE04324.1 hypothetical protein [Spirochaetia bacterium]
MAFTGKGGEGKTIAALNISLALSFLHSRTRTGAVLYIDCDLGCGEKNLNWNIDTPNTMADYLNGTKKFSEIVYSKLIAVEGQDIRVDIVSARIEKIPDDAALNSFFEECAAAGYQYIILDIGAGTRHKMFKFVALAHYVICLLRDNVNTLRDTVDIINAAWSYNQTAVYFCILNRQNFTEERKSIINSLSRESRLHSGTENTMLLNDLALLKSDLSMKEYFILRKKYFFYTPHYRICSRLNEAMARKLYISNPQENRCIFLADALNSRQKNFEPEFGIIYDIPWLNEYEQPAPNGKILLPGHSSDFAGASFLSSAAAVISASGNFQTSATRIFIFKIKLLTRLLSVKDEEVTGREKLDKEEIDFIWNYRNLPAFRRVYRNCQLFLTPKGGVGQTETIYNLAALRPRSEGSLLLLDCSRLMTADDSAVMTYFSVNQPRALVSIAETSGQIFTIDKNLKIDAFLFSRPPADMPVLDFLRSLSERLMQTAAGYHNIFIDTQSGFDRSNLLLALLFGKITVFSDINDPESHHKLFLMLAALADYLYALNTPRSSFPLSIVFSRLDEKMLVRQEQRTVFSRTWLDTFMEKIPHSVIFKRPALFFLHHSPWPARALSLLSSKTMPRLAALEPREYKSAYILDCQTILKSIK